jgi:hypothetical protein
MLAAAIGNYIDSLTEREFDTPFIALLRLHGFTDLFISCTGPSSSARISSPS